MTSFRPLVPLFMAAALLLGANGALGTVVALRASAENFGATVIGVMTAGYFAGYLAGCIRAPALIAMVGHIRVFGAMAALLAATSLTMNITVEPISWVLLRTMQGFAFCGIFTVVESWLNENAKNTDRARVLGVYRMIDIFVVSASQFLVPLLGVTEYLIFSVIGIFFSLSLVPVSLSSRSKPGAPVEFAFDLPMVWKLSPLACTSCIAVGLTNSSFRFVGPIYGEAVGFDGAGVAAFMSAGILGAGALQLPLGYFSDRFGRRPAILLTSIGAAVAGMMLSNLSGNDAQLIYIGAFLFGAFALPLYSLSAAHANDMAAPGTFVVVAAGLTFFYASGAVVGPLLSSVLIDVYGARALFTYTTIVHTTLIVITIFRAIVGQRVPKDKRTQYEPLLRTSPVFHRLARSGTNGGNGSGSDGARPAKSNEPNN